MRVMVPQNCEEASISKNPHPPLFTFRGLRGRALIWFLCLAYYFSLSSAFATTIKPVSEIDLIKSAKAIVLGQVTTIESIQEPQAGRIFTYITLTLDEVLKGTVSGDTLTIKQAGGVVGNTGSWREGSPEFTLGEKVLLFVTKNNDGSARVAHLYQGKFSISTDPSTGKEIAQRPDPPPGVFTLEGSDSGGTTTTSTDTNSPELSAFKSRISATVSQEQAQGFGPQPDPIPSPPALPPDSRTEVRNQFTLLSIPPVRWFEPDQGQPVVIAIDDRGEPNAPDLGFPEIDAALQAWTNVTNSSFRYLNGGLTTPRGFRNDGVNVVSFRDPDGEIDLPINCTGVLAFGGASGFDFNQTRFIFGQVFSRITDGDVVFAAGWEGCGFYEDARNFAEVATHELGHVLGLGHSPDSDATMFPFVHFDGRGASLRGPDEQGLRFLYPANLNARCSYSRSPSNRTYNAPANIGKIKVSTKSLCGWVAKSNAPWIFVTSSPFGLGKGTVSYIIDDNDTGFARKGTITIAGKLFTIKQKKAGSSGSSPLPRAL